MLAAGLDVEIEVDGDARIAGPPRMWRIGAVATKIAGWTEIGLVLEIWRGFWRAESTLPKRLRDP